MSKRGKYGLWTETDMAMAIRAYNNGEAGLNECARRYNINKSTLLRHVRGTNKLAKGNVKRLGTKCVFSPETESALVKHIIQFEEMLYGFTITDIRRLAFQLAQKHNLPHPFNRENKIAGKKWFYGFMRRHPELAVRQPESTSLARARGFQREKVMQFFDILETLVDKYKITANTIFNVDESGYTTVQKKMQKVVSQKGKRQVSGIASGERGVNTTMVCCCNAAGLYIPPMLIFKRKRFAPELARGAPTGSLTEISDTGYINSDLFVKWLKHFHGVVKSSQDKPVIILLDGHSTHSKNLEALEYARQHHIHLLQLPGHTTHRLQPLDVGFFKPLQNYYVQEQDSWLRAHVGQPISVYNVAELLGRAYGKAATVGISESAFRGAGIWPPNRNKFGDHLFAPSTAIEPTDESQEDAVTLTEPGKLERAVGCTPPPQPSSSSSCSYQRDATSSCVPGAVSCFNRVLGEVTPEKLNRSLNELAPVPGTSKVVQKRQKKTTAAAVVLTSTPYKEDLQEKKRKALPQIKRKPKVLKREKAVEKASVDLFSATEKKNPNKKGKAPVRDQSPEETDSEDSQSNDELCIFCNESYFNSKPNEGWAQCQRCSKWAHEQCAGIEDEENFICDFCLHIL